MTRALGLAGRLALVSLVIGAAIVGVTSPFGPAGLEVRPHNHNEDEIVYILEGGLSFDGNWYGPGSVLSFPRRVTYGFTVGPQGVKWLMVRTGPSDGELDFLRYAARHCPTVLLALTKIDLAHRWRHVADRHSRKECATSNLIWRRQHFGPTTQPMADLNSFIPA